MTEDSSGPKDRIRPKVVAFDIIGTIFELEPLRPLIVDLGLPGASLEGWIAAAYRDAMAMAAIGDYRPFSEVEGAALDEILAEQKLDPLPTAKQALLDAMADMTPREGARAALQAVSDSGTSIMALTNGSADATRKLLHDAGFLRLFAQIVSTDEVQLAKPRLEVYRHACEKAELRPDELALVAAHPWDIQGAAAAGLTTAYLAADRPYASVVRRPHIEATDLAGCVRALLALPRAR